MEQASLIDNVKEILELRKELFKVNIVEKTSRIGSKIATSILALFMVALSMFFIGFGLSIAVNLWLNTAVWGYFIVGALLMLFTLLLLKFGGKKLSTFLAFKILKTIEDEDDYN